jgi:hypothetical protein
LEKEGYLTLIRFSCGLLQPWKASGLDRFLNFGLNCREDEERGMRDEENPHASLLTTHTFLSRWL